MKPRKPILGRSLADTNHKVANQWHPTKNGLLLQECFTHGSFAKVWRQNHFIQEWQAIINYREIKIRERIDPNQLTMFQDKK